jgi:hypothetical protein
MVFLLLGGSAYYGGFPLSKRFHKATQIAPKRKWEKKLLAFKSDGGSVRRIIH